MDTTEFRRHAHAFVDWMADYLAEVERYPVRAQVKPGEVAAKLPLTPPERGDLSGLDLGAHGIALDLGQGVGHPVDERVGVAAELRGVHDRQLTRPSGVSDHWRSDAASER